MRTIILAPLLAVAVGTTVDGAEPAAVTATPAAMVAETTELPLADLASETAGIASWGVVLTRRADGWLEVASGHALPWPTVSVDRPQDLGAYGAVAVEVRNPGATAIEVSLRVDVRAAQGGGTRSSTGVVPVAPGATATLAVELDCRAADAPPGFAPIGLSLAPPGFGGPLDGARFTGVRIFIDRPARDATYQLRGLRALPRSVRPLVPRLPLIDRYGQYLGADWPGRITADGDFAARRAAEDTDLAAHPAPAAWDDWGGWAGGPQLEASGRFRTAKVDGRWWLVDPAGRLFWSQGVTCVGLLEDTPVEDREAWFADYPGALPEFASCVDTFAWLRSRGGHYAGRTPRGFSFSQANLLRKYGAEWLALSGAEAHRRLRSWGLNTLGNWSDPRIALAGVATAPAAVGTAPAQRTAYTLPLHPPSPAIAGCGVRDPYDPRFAAALREQLARQPQALGDPWCLGFFVDNEIAWGDEADLARWTLAAPATQPAKRAFVAALTAQYGDIARLNAAWGTAHAGWDALLAARQAPAGDAALADLRAFTRSATDTWYRTCKEVIAAADPGALFLGTRLHVWNPAVVAAAAAHCDVVSFNLYRAAVADFAPGAAIDRPMLVSEFHTGAADRGLPRGGLVVSVATQAERAARYRGFVASALSHPGIVGAHWFQYRDEPATGRRLDGENYQIGFVDGTDVPYAELVGAARTLATGMYAERAGSGQ